MLLTALSTNASGHGSLYFSNKFFSKESVLDKTLFVKEIIKKGNYWLPTVLEMHKPNGNHTIMRVEAFKPDAKLDDEIFTEAFLIQQD